MSGIIKTIKIVKILLVEDSYVQQELLIQIIRNCPTLQIIGLAKDGVEAIEFIKKSKPDVVLMDLHMPKMNGILAIREIMRTMPLPIVAMSASSDVDDVINGFHAMEAGAVAFVEKPVGIKDSRYDSLCQYLLKTVELMSEVKVIRRHDYSKSHLSLPHRPAIKTIEAIEYSQEIDLIAIGVSTGGPLVLQTIFSHIPLDFPPILVIQHIAPGFILGMTQWLMQMTNRSVNLAEDKQIPARGHIYFAPDHYHMGIGKNGHIFLTSNTLKYSICPSVDFLFQTVAEAKGKKAMGILLTGMGNDGVKQLNEMRKKGAITIAQNKETSLIYGMPGQAVSTGAARYVLTPYEIAMSISLLAKEKTT